MSRRDGVQIGTITSDDVHVILGEVDESLVAELVGSQATAADLLEAARELEAETESGQRVHGPEAGPVAQLRSILWDAVSSGRWMPLEDDEGHN